VIDQRDLVFLRQCFLEQWLDEVEEVVNLFELAAAVLIELALAREDVQLFEQRGRLFGADFVFLGHGGSGGQVRARV